MIGVAAAIVATSVLTISSGSRSVAFGDFQDGDGRMTGAGQVLPASGVEPSIRLEIGQVEAGKTVRIPVVLNVATSGLWGYQIEISLEDSSITLISRVESPDSGLSS